MRNRYITPNDSNLQILSNVFNLEQILVYTSVTNRTYMSSESFLNGLYPSGTGTMLKPHQLTAAIPPIDGIKPYYQEAINELRDGSLPNYTEAIPSVSFENRHGGNFDYKYQAHKYCLKVWSYNQKKYAQSYEYKQNANNFSNLAKKLSKNWDSKIEWDLEKIYQLADNIECAKYMGAKLLHYLDNATLDELSFQSQINTRYEFLGSYGNNQLMSFYLLRELGDHFHNGYNSILSNLPFEKKFRFAAYFISDANLDSFAKIMNMTGNRFDYPVKFASTILIEFKTDNIYDDQRNWKVEITYNNDKLYVNGKKNLTSGEFLDTLKAHRIGNGSDAAFIDYCESNPVDIVNSQWVSWIIIIVILGLGIVIYIFFHRKYRKEQFVKYYADDIDEPLTGQIKTKEVATVEVLE